MHWLLGARDQPALHQVRETIEHAAFVSRVDGEVRLLPTTKGHRSLELLALGVDKLFGERLALGAHFKRRHVRRLLPTKLFQNLVFDWQDRKSTRLNSSH